MCAKLGDPRHPRLSKPYSVVATDLEPIRESIMEIRGCILCRRLGCHWRVRFSPAPDKQSVSVYVIVRINRKNDADA
jgi:hypothetical protein